MYNPQKFGREGKTIEQYRKEYAREYEKLQARRRSLEKAGFGWTQAAKRVRELKPVSKLSDKELKWALADVYSEVERDYTKIAWQRNKEKELQQVLHKRGIDAQTQMASDFIDDYKARGLNQIYGSERMLEAIDYLEKIGISSEDLLNEFEKYVNEIDELADRKSNE